MCKHIKYPEERRQDEFDVLLKQMIKDQKLVADLLFKEVCLTVENNTLKDRVAVLEGFVEEVGKMAKTIK